jgi:hypothetical protein
MNSRNIAVLVHRRILVQPTSSSFREILNASEVLPRMDCQQEILWCRFG